MITQIVVMGGYGSGGSGSQTSTEILDVDTMTWGTGPTLPTTIYFNKGVKSEVGPYLGFSTGGVGRPSTTNKIYGLTRTSRNGFKWETVHSMTTARRSHSVVNAPKSFLPNC